METEKKLIEAIELDLEKTCGSSSRNTKSIVAAIIVHLKSAPSTDFISVLDKYRTNLQANVECASSQRYYQRIYSAEERSKGIFFLDDPWGRAIKLWIQESSNDIPAMEALDDLYTSAPQGKPTKKWQKQIQELFLEFSEERIINIVRYLIGQLIEAENITKTGIWSDNERKLKAMVILLTLNKNDEDAELLRKLAIICYTKIPYEGPMSIGVGNICLQGLSELDGSQGLIYLSELSRQLKYPTNAVKFAKKRLEEAAKEKGIKVHELESIAVPDYGLKD